MASKLPFIVGLGAGYVLGTRAGRAQYERIKATATRVAEQPFVREKVDTASTRAQEYIRAQGAVVTDKLVDAVKERLFGTPAGTARPATQGAPRSAAASAVEVDDAEVRPIS